jgi:5-formyltetrahydrofolate cyclo-ligase
MDSSDLKTSVRKEILGKRNALLPQEIKELSSAIQKNLSVLDSFVKSKIVLFYASHISEVRTDEMILESLLSRKVLLPRMEGGGIIPTLIMDLDNLIPGYGGIREPLLAPSVKSSSIDCVIVPGIAFDEFGNRVGTGKGFYDKFLKKATHAVKIGLAFESQMVDSIDQEEHDVQMDFVVTEKRIIDCRKPRP